MKAKIKEKEATEVTIEVTIESEAVDNKLDEIYNRSVQELDLPGFRKGKVPRSFIKARFGEDVFYDDAKEELIEEYLPRALKENEIEPMSEPEAQPQEFTQGEEFVFEVSVEVMPDVEVPEYSEIEVGDVEAEKVEEEDVEDKIQEMQRENGQLVPKKEEVVESGDYVTAEFSDGGTQQVSVDEEKNSSLAQFIGKEVGDVFEFELEGEGEDLEATELKVESIKQLDLPPVDDEFAKDLGYEDLEALRAKVKTDLFEEKEEKRVQDLGEKILDTIIEESGFEPPDKTLQNISEGQIQDTIDSVGEERFLDLLEEQGKTREDFEADIQKSASEQIARRVLIEQIAVEEGIELTDEELEEELEEEADRQGVNPIKLKNQLKAQDQFERFKDALLRRKVFDFLIDAVTIQTEEGNDE
ncbi:MAG: trigger factor [Candidatus Acetothermia bacterium]